MRSFISTVSLLTALSLRVYSQSNAVQSIIIGELIASSDLHLVSQYDPNTEFVYYAEGNGMIDIEVGGRSYGSALQIHPPGSIGELVFQEDGRLVEMDMNGKIIWNSTSISGNQGPYTMTVEGDRKARIRDANGNAIWDFPGARPTVTNLNSDIMNFIRTGETISSPNGHFNVTILESGALVCSDGTVLSEPSPVNTGPRMLSLDGNGILELRDAFDHVRWIANGYSTTSSDPYVLQISNTGNVSVFDGDYRSTWSMQIKDI